MKIYRNTILNNMCNRNINIFLPFSNCNAAQAVKAYLENWARWSEDVVLEKYKRIQRIINFHCKSADV